MKRKYAIIILTTALISFCMHFQHFPKELMGQHVWRQTQTQSTIINFYEEDMNIFHPRRNERGNGDGIFTMEFPLMQWLVVLVYKILGPHLIITRLFLFLVGIGTVAGMYKLLQAFFQKEIPAVVGAWAFNFSPAFFYYTINPLPDNFALCCAIWGMALFLVWYRKQDNISSLVYSGMLLSIAALCKLPFILYFSVHFLYFLLQWSKTDNRSRLIKNTLLLLKFVLPPLCWYVMAVPSWKGNGIVAGVFGNTTSLSLIGEYISHHILVTFPDLLLNYGAVLFFLAAFWFLVKHKKFRHPFLPLMLIWGLVILAYLLFEINMIEKVHDYYLFPFYPLLFILVGYGAYKLYILNKVTRYLTICLLLLLPFTAFLRMKNAWNPDNPGFNKDLLLYKDVLRKAVPEDALCIVGKDLSHFIFLYYIQKKGWVFDYDQLSGAELYSMIQKGAQYLYCDSRMTDENPLLRPYLDKLVMQKGSIWVYHLSMPPIAGKVPKDDSPLKGPFSYRIPSLLPDAIKKYDGIL